MSRFGLDLSKVSRLGGHSFERTHRGGAQFPGMTITVSLVGHESLFLSFSARLFSYYPTSVIASIDTDLPALHFVVVAVLFLIQYAQMEALEELAEKEPARVQIIKKAAVTSLIKDGDKVIGVNYTYDGQELKEYGPVVLATGTFSLTFAVRDL